MIEIVIHRQLLKLGANGAIRLRGCKTTLSYRLATSFRLHHALGRSGMPGQHLWGADRSWHKITTAVWANAVQHIVGAGGAERAFISTYAGVGRVRR